MSCNRWYLNEDAERTIELHEYFDLSNIDHLKAYRHLVDTGHWPESFESELFQNKVQKGQYWDIQLKTKMAYAWINEKLSLDKTNQK